jgi:hypothetical protein
MQVLGFKYVQEALLTLTDEDVCHKHQRRTFERFTLFRYDFEQRTNS